MIEDDRKAYQRAYYLAHRDEIKARTKAYAQANKEKIAVKNKEFRAKNRERLSAKARESYLANRAERLAQVKARSETRREAIAAYQKEWQRKNRDKIRAHRASIRDKIRAQTKAWYDRTYHAGQREKFLARNKKREALKRASAAEDVDLKKILRESKGICGICRKPLDLFGIDFDHIVPLSRGGSHTAGNIQATHSYCNRSKGAKVS